MGSLKGKRIAVYARFSTDKQSDSSIEDQVHRAHEWLRAQGADPDAALVLSDRAVSGASMQRPGMRTLLAAIDAGTLDLVVTESVDRISRDAHDALGFRKTLAHRGVALECLDGTRINADDKNGLLMFGLRSMLGEQYLIDLADKTRRGLVGLARAGKVTGGLPYGYRSSRDGTSAALIQVDADQARVVRRLFELYASGFSMAAVADRLNSEGVHAPRAHSRRTAVGWMASAVREMLLNERYRGVWSYGEREWRKVPGTNRRIARERAGGPLVRLELPELAIVDPELWGAVQARFALHAEMPKARRRYVLSGLLHCGECGGPLQVHGGSSTHRYYGCANARKRGATVCANRANILSTAVEDLVLELIRSLLTDALDEVQEIVVEEIRAWEREQPNQRAYLAEQLRGIESKLGNLVDALMTTRSSAIAAKLSELEAQRDRVRSELDNFEASAPVLPSPAEITRRVLALSSLRDQPADTAREALRIVLDGGRIDCAPLADGTCSVRMGLLPAVLLGQKERKPPLGEPGSGVSILMVAGAGFEPTTFGL